MISGRSRSVLTIIGLQQTAAQTADAKPYTDAESGITFKTWSTGANVAPFTFGLSLPSDALEKDATEYIGLLVGRMPVECARFFAHSP